MPVTPYHLVPIALVALIALHLPTAANDGMALGPVTLDQSGPTAACMTRADRHLCKITFEDGPDLGRLWLDPAPPRQRNKDMIGQTP